MLMPERTAFWTRARTLIVSDLHWGKSEAMQRQGIPLPSMPLGLDLSRLERAISRTGANRLLVLGDLVHSPSGMTPGILEAVSAWRRRLRDVKMCLIPGNHDRKVSLPEAWRLEILENGICEGPFSFCHGDRLNDVIPERLTWMGHIHPSVRLRSGADRLRLPCFVIERNTVLLPAFGSTTGNFDVNPALGAQVFAVGDTFVKAVLKTMSFH